MKILVTGFDPFGEEKINPSIEAVKLLPSKIEGAEILKIEIPTMAKRSLEIIETAIKTYDPSIILCVGQAGGRADITVERVGINVDDYRIKDNAGNQIIDEPIYEDGPDAYFVNIPIKAMVNAVREEGIPASISNSAGTFVCNHVTYGVRYLVENLFPGKKSGFIHIPYLPEQTIGMNNMPSMCIETIVKGLVAAIAAMITVEEDSKTTGGTIC